MIKQSLLSKIFFKMSYTIEHNRFVLSMKPRLGRVGTWVWNHCTNRRVRISYKGMTMLEASGMELEEPTQLGFGIKEKKLDEWDLSSFTVIVDGEKVYGK